MSAGGARAPRAIAAVRRLDATVAAPPSKSVTQRALVAASLADGPSVLRRPLLGDDGRRMIDALRLLGVEVRVEGAADGAVVTVAGRPASPPAAGLRLDAGDAGTAMRFLAARCAAEPVAVILDGSARMRQRPIEDLLAALRALGADAATLGPGGCPPVRVGGRGIAGGEARLRGSLSSQYLSALLLAAPAARAPVTLTIEGDLVSRPYVDLTLAVMRAFGIGEVEVDPARRYRVAGPASYRQADLLIEGDWSSASYWFLAAAIVPGRVAVGNLDAGSAQGDRRLLGLLEAMGCRVEPRAGAITVEGPDRLSGIDADLRDLPDMAPTLAVAALFADRPTTIRGVAHLRLKESDRIATLCAAVAALGGEAAPRPDGIAVTPRPLSGAPVDPHADHRLAMAFAIAGLRLPGVSILDPACAGKSYPSFWDDLDRVSGPGVRT